MRRIMQSSTGTRTIPSTSARSISCRRKPTSLRGQVSFGFWSHKMSASPLTFSVYDEVPQDAATIIDGGLGASNAAAAPLHEVCQLSCLCRLATGKIVGGAVGRTWGVCCEIQQVWVQFDHRRKGIGSRLIRELHRRAEERGCRTFYLETWSFQAPRIYQSLGYDVRLEITGFREGIIKYIMVRKLPR
jgi:ribosomal protein S18 acetylase RimI-like enzyme